MQNGEDPQGITRKEGAIVPTYCNNTVMRIPPESTQEKNRELLLSTGRRLAESYLNVPPAVVAREKSKSE